MRRTTSPHTLTSCKSSYSVCRCVASGEPSSGPADCTVHIVQPEHCVAMHAGDMSCQLPTLFLTGMPHMCLVGESGNEALVHRNKVILCSSVYTGAAIHHCPCCVYSSRLHEAAVSQVVHIPGKHRTIRAMHQQLCHLLDSISGNWNVDRLTILFNRQYKLFLCLVNYLICITKGLQPFA